MTIRRLLSLSILAVACGGLSQPEDREASPTARFAPCPAMDGSLCGSLEVPEDRQRPNGRRLSLNLLVYPALERRAAQAPVVIIAGDPGVGSTALAAEGDDWLLRRLRPRHDVVYVDQRGTGGSHPLRCDLWGPNGDPQGHFAELFPLDRVRACRKRLEATADLRRYTTPHAVSDLEAVRQELGYERWSLVAASYGTQPALQYLRRYPHRVRALALAGVLTPRMKMPLQFARGAQHSLDRLIQDCRTDLRCAAAFPRFATELTEVLGRLERSPATVALPDPETGRVATLQIPRDSFVEHLRLSLYYLKSSSRLPLQVQQAHRGDFAPFGARALSRSRRLASAVALGMYLTVTCAEGATAATEAEIAASTQGTFIGESRVRAHQAACREWVLGDRADDFDAPIRANAPVLILAGELDGATPAEFTDELLPGLPNARRILVPNEPHEYNSECLNGLIAEFLEAGTTRDLDVRCVAENRRPPFDLPPSLPEASTTAPPGRP